MTGPGLPSALSSHSIPTRSERARHTLATKVARKRRVQYPGATYDMMNRGAAAERSSSTTRTGCCC